MDNSTYVSKELCKELPREYTFIKDWWLFREVCAYDSSE